MPARLCIAIRHSAHRAGVSADWSHDPALARLIRSESGFREQAVNRSSGACGLYQFLPCRWRTLPNAYHQSVKGLAYIKQRYGTPATAWRFHLRKGWY